MPEIVQFNITEFNSHGLTLNLTYNDPYKVSNSLHLDRLQIQVLDVTYFRSEKDMFTTMEPDFQMKTKSIPPQVTQEMHESIDSTNGSVETLTNLFSLSTITVNVLLGFSLKFLWGLVNVL